MTKTERDGRRRSVWAAARPLAAIVAVTVAVGCGGSSEPKVPESAQLLVQARQAMGEGNTEKALEALDASIASAPNTWAYLERARIRATKGEDDAARADCAEVLKLAPENRDVPWIQGELKKPVGKRFQGKFAIAPSFKK
jgi:Tfp pilus assembly protein PilF